MHSNERIPVVIYRGGTSKAVMIESRSLPQDSESRDSTILRIFGSPDRRQIDGLGGADPLTSKVAVMGPPTKQGADMDYTFGQVEIEGSRVHYNAVCGNISAAVGSYAVEEGYVRPVSPWTTVRVHCTNIGCMLKIKIPVEDGRVLVRGDYSIDGAPGAGAKIELDWADAIGANTGALLPTGNACDVLKPDGMGEIEASLVDVGNLGAFVKAADLGLIGTEGPNEIDGDRSLLDKCEAITECASRFVGKRVYLTLVSSPSPYTAYASGKQVSADDIDFVVRMIFMGGLHKAFAASQINCCGAAALVPDSVVNRCMENGPRHSGKVRMGHPSGVAQLDVDVSVEGDRVDIHRLLVGRTARRIMDGYVYLQTI